MKQNSQSFYEHKTSPVFWFFLCISIPLIIGIVGFASGYRVDSVSGELVENGLVHINANVQAQTTINGAIVSKEMPYISVLEPGEYTVSVSKDGYHEWRKILDIQPGLSNVYTDTLLFAKNDFEEYIDKASVPEYVEFDKLPRLYWQTYKEHGWTDPELLEYAIIDDRVIVRDAGQKQSYILTGIEDLDSFFTIPDVVRGAVGVDTDIVLFTDNEIRIFQTATETLESVIRSTELIHDVVAYEDKPYAFFSDTSGTYAVEFIDAKPQIWQLSQKQCDELQLNQKRLLCQSREGSYVMQLW